MKKRLSSQKGSATLEFLTILPVVLLLSLVVWQFFVAGLAVMDAQSLVSEAARYASLDQEEAEEAKEKALKKFGDSSYYNIKNFEVEIEDEEAIAQVETEIQVVFFPSAAFSYKTMKTAPVMD